MADPIPDIPLPSVEPERLPIPQDTHPVSPGAYGAALGEGLQRLGAGLDRYQMEADAMAAQEAETAFGQEILQKVHGTGELDPETGQLTSPGFRSLRGHAALQASQPLTEELTARREQLSSGLANDRQRRLFYGRSQWELVGAQRAIEQHVSQEVAYLQQQGAKTRLEVAAKNAVAAVSPSPVDGPEATAIPDLAEAQRQISAMEPWLAVDAETRGLRGPDAERYVRSQQGAVAVAVIERLLEQPRGGSAARAFLDHNRDIIDEKDAYRFRAQLRVSDIRDQSMTEADRIWAEADGDPLKAVAAVRAIKNPELRDAVDQRVGRRISEDRAVRVAADAPREGRLEQVLFQGQKLDRLSQDYQALSDEGKARIDAKAFAYQRSLRAEGTADRRTQNDADRAALAWFDALPLSGARGRDQASLDIEHAPELGGASPVARDIARKRQRLANDAVQRGLAPNLAEFRSLVATQGRAVLKSKDAQAQFAASMQEWWQQQVDVNKGRLPDRAAVAAKMADALLYGDEEGGSLWSRDKFKFQAEKKGERFVPFKPEEQKYGPNRPPAAGIPAPAPAPKLYRRVDPATGEARVWNGTAWVPEGTR